MSYALQSQSLHPAGSSAARRTVQYGLAMMLLQTVPVAIPHAMRAMVIKQGISVTTAGRGALNAAYAGLGQVSGIVFPLLWGYLFKCFSRGAGPKWLRWGPGGHFLVTAAVMAGACALVHTADPATLFPEDRGQAERGGKSEAEPG